MLTVPLLQAGGIIVLLFFAVIILIGLAMTALSIYAVYWTYKDASRRGMDNPELWALIVFFGSIPGLIAYFLIRE